LTAAKVKQGVAEVTEGKTFCLSLPLDYPGGTVVNARRHPPRLIANQREGMPYIAYPLARENPQFVDVICDGIVEMTLQYSTQWDSLAHVGQLFDADGDGKPEIVFYNGYRAGEDIIGPVDYRDGGAVGQGEHVGALALGIENLAAHPVQGRGVMIDLERHCGRGEEFVGYDRLMRIMEADKVEVTEGDLLCFRTGYDRVILGMNKHPDAATLAANPGAGLDGRDERFYPFGRRRPHLRQPRGRADAVATVRGRGFVCLAAAPRALPVQARGLSRRNLAIIGPGRLAARAQSLALLANRAALASAGRGRLAGQCRGNRLKRGKRCSISINSSPIVAPPSPEIRATRRCATSSPAPSPIRLPS
jgi:hypothetical protein